MVTQTALASLSGSQTKQSLDRRDLWGANGRGREAGGGEHGCRVFCTYVGLPETKFHFNQDTWRCLVGVVGRVLFQHQQE